MRGQCTALVGHLQTRCTDPSAATDDAGHAVCLYHFGVPAYQFDGDAHDLRPTLRPEETVPVTITPDRQLDRAGPAQTRRAISLKGLTFQRLASYCEEQGVSVTSFIEELIVEGLDRAGAPPASTLRPRPGRPKPSAPDADIAGELASGIWTF